MKYVFFGTPDFASIVLGKLIEAGLKPAVLVCNPDRPVGRKKIITPPATKKLLQAVAPEIPVLQPEKPKEIESELKALEPDLFVVAAYARIIPKSVLAIPNKGSLGVHPSLLPRYRGSSPIQSAILNGEKETGICLYVLDDQVDHGPIVACTRTAIEGRNYQELERHLAELGGTLAAHNLNAFINGAVKPVEQDHSLATVTGKFISQDGFIASEELKEAFTNKEKAVYIHNKIAALNPEPGAWTLIREKRVKLLGSEIGNNGLILKMTQLEGEKPKAVHLSELPF